MPSTIATAAFLAANGVLGILMSQYSILAFVHALVTAAVALRWAARSTPERAGCAIAYVSGSEVLWRMTTDRLPWELGKYAVIAIAAVGIIRVRGVKGLVPPLLFFSLLLPSAAFTVLALDAEEARQQISFNLSGPLALVICAGFFSLAQLSVKELQRILLALVGPVVGIASVAVFGIITAPEIAFNTESNFATSGGFGPNQVSAMLGLGALFAFLSLFANANRGSWPFRLLMFGVMSWLAAQSALTFSRGGLFAAGGAAGAALACLARDSRMRMRVLLVASLVFVLGRYVVWPRLDEFTGGTITQRFSEADLTRRGDLGEEDLATWGEHPVLGVGPGQSSLMHDDSIIAHTEFTRLLAEHGAFGAAAIVLVILAGCFNVKRAGIGTPQGLVLALITWSCLFMLNSAMRTAAPSFLFGFSFAGFGTTRRLAPAPQKWPGGWRPNVLVPAWRGQ